MKVIPGDFLEGERGPEAANRGCFAEDDYEIIEMMAKDEELLNLLIEGCSSDDFALLAELDEQISEYFPDEDEADKRLKIKDFIRDLFNTAKYDKSFKYLYQNLVSSKDHPQLFRELLGNYLRGELGIVVAEDGKKYFEKFLEDVIRLHQNKDFTHSILIVLFNASSDRSVLTRSKHPMVRIASKIDHNILDRELIKFVTQRYSWLENFLQDAANFSELDNLRKIIFIFRGFGIDAYLSRKQPVVMMMKSDTALEEKVMGMGYAEKYFSQVIRLLERKEYLAVDEVFLTKFHVEINLNYNGRIVTLPFPAYYLPLFQEFCIKYLPLNIANDVLGKWAQERLHPVSYKGQVIDLIPKISPPLKLNFANLEKYCGCKLVKEDGFINVLRTEETEKLVANFCAIGLPYIEAILGEEKLIESFKIHEKFLERNLFQCFDLSNHKHVILSDIDFIRRFVARYTVLQKIKPGIVFKTVVKNFLDSYVFAEGDREILNGILTEDLLRKLKEIDPQYHSEEQDFALTTYRKLVEFVEETYFCHNAVEGIIEKRERGIDISQDRKGVVNEIVINFSLSQAKNLKLRKIPGLEFVQVMKGRILYLSMLMVDVVEFAEVGLKKFHEAMYEIYGIPKTKAQLKELKEKSDEAERELLAMLEDTSNGKKKSKSKKKAAGGASGGTSIVVLKVKDAAVIEPVVYKVVDEKAEEKRKILEEIKDLLNLQITSLRQVFKGNIIPCADIKNIEGVKFSAMVFSRKKGQLRVDIDKERIDKSDLDELKKFIAEEKQRLEKEKKEKGGKERELLIAQMQQKLDDEELSLKIEEEKTIEKSVLEGLYQKIRKEFEDKIKILMQENSRSLEFLENNGAMIQLVAERYGMLEDGNKILDEIRISLQKQIDLEKELYSKELSKKKLLSEESYKIADLQESLNKSWVEELRLMELQKTRYEKKLAEFLEEDVGPDAQMRQLERRRILLDQRKKDFEDLKEMKSIATRMRSDFVDSVIKNPLFEKGLDSELQKYQYWLYEREAKRLSQIVRPDGELRDEIIAEISRINAAKNQQELFVAEMQQFLAIAGREGDKNLLWKFLPLNVLGIINAIKTLCGDGAQYYIHGGILYKNKTQDLDVQIDYAGRFLPPGLVTEEGLKSWFSGIDIKLASIVHKGNIAAYSIKFGDIFDITICAQSYQESSNYISYYDGVRLGVRGFELKKRYRDDFIKQHKEITGDASQYPYHEKKYLEVINITAKDFYLRASYQLLNNPFVTEEMVELMNEKIVESLRTLFIQGKNEDFIDGKIRKFTEDHNMSAEDVARFRDGLSRNCVIARKMKEELGPSKAPSGGPEAASLIDTGRKIG